MLLVIVLVVVLVLIAVTGLIIWIRRAASCARILGLPGGTPAKRFSGGVMCRYLITSGPLARLEFLDSGVRIRGIAASRWIVPTWEARYSELATAELVMLTWSKITVWFRLRDGSAAIGFLSDYSRDILTELQKHDVQIDRSVTKVSRVAELYRNS